MDESELNAEIDLVRQGRLSRRAFVARMARLGLSAPLASLMLMHAGIAQPRPATPYAPTRRGGGGVLKMLLWQGPTLLNPHFATGTKDQEGARIFYEPLARWDGEGNLLPVLAAEIPNRENGGLAADGRSVTWKLKPGVSWHDGAPFTADDVIFNWQYATDPASPTFTAGAFQDLRLEKMDAHTVRVLFAEPSPFWPGTYCTVALIPRHVFAPHMGAKAQQAPANLSPVGTGPYRFVEFKPGDLIRAEINPNYHASNRPHFDSVEMKGGGEAVSAARAVLQTGEYDYAWNIAVEDEILRRMEAVGKGRVVFAPGGTAEAIYLNHADPNTEIDGERSSPTSSHPLFRDPVLRRAMALLVDRQGIQDYIWGRGGVATANFINNPTRFRSPNMKLEFNIDKANAQLDAAGYRRGADGVREKDGRRLRFVFQTSISAPRQKAQAIVKQAAQKAGIEIELKAVVASVFFSSDIANPDTFQKFYADLEMFAVDQGPPDPWRLLQCFSSSEISSKATQWQGINRNRWRSAEYDQLSHAAATELDPVKRAALLIRMNDLVCSDGYVIPLLYRPAVTALRQGLVAPMTGWDNDMSSLAEWHRQS
jgi:peptide/nickel transport system substrate-binding protein